jgi:hypothetical protein
MIHDGIVIGNEVEYIAFGMVLSIVLGIGSRQMRWSEENQGDRRYDVTMKSE